MDKFPQYERQKQSMADLIPGNSLLTMIIALDLLSLYFMQTDKTAES